MTFDPSLTRQELVLVIEIEPARRLEEEVWTQADAPNTSCYYIAHPEGEPSRVKECLKSTGVILTYTERASLALCQANASSWYFDPATSRLYVHTSTGADPGGGLFLVDSYFWERLADREIVLDGYQYRPCLTEDSIPEFTFEVKPFSEGGISQTFGAVTVLNGDGYWDERLYKYVYEGKRIVVKFGKVGDDYAAYLPAIDGYTGGNSWTDEAVVFESEDPARLQE